jgi:hypothetical protein
MRFPNRRMHPAKHQPKAVAKARHNHAAVRRHFRDAPGLSQILQLPRWADSGNYRVPNQDSSVPDHAEVIHRGTTTNLTPPAQRHELTRTVDQNVIFQLFFTFSVRERSRPRKPGNA